MIFGRSKKLPKPYSAAGYSPARRIRYAAVSALLFLAVTAYAFGFRLYKSGYTFSALVDSTNQLRVDDPVRVGGLDVGKIDKIDGAGEQTVLRLRITDKQVKVRKDARLTIRSRMFLEGAYYVELEPGTPTGQPAADDFVLSADRTSRPVQIDQLLSAFPADIRGRLQDMVASTADSLSTKHGPSGAKAIGNAASNLAPALLDLGAVAKSALGESKGDLASAIRNLNALTKSLNQDSEALVRLLRSSGRFFTVLGQRDQELAQVAESFGSLTSDGVSKLAKINGGLDALTQIAKDLQPISDQIPESGPQVTKLLRQVRLLAGPDELRRLFANTSGLLQESPMMMKRLNFAFPQLRDLSECQYRVIFPTMNQVLPDGVHTTGDPAWLDGLHMAANLAAGSPSFDGNGSTIRFGVSLGEMSFEANVPGLGKSIGLANKKPQGVSPFYEGLKSYSFRPDQPCARQKLPDLKEWTGGPDIDLNWSPEVDVVAKDLKTLASQGIAGLSRVAQDPQAQRSLADAVENTQSQTKSSTSLESTK